MNIAAGSTCDISPLLHFHFWQPVYFNLDNSRFSSKSTEEIGRFVDTSENISHDRNVSILNTATNKVISMYNGKPADEPTSPNLRIDPLDAPEVVTSRHLHPVHLEDDEKAHVVTKTESPNASASSSKQIIPILDPNDLVGRDFLFHKKMVNVYELE